MKSSRSKSKDFNAETQRAQRVPKQEIKVSLQCEERSDEVILSSNAYSMRLLRRYASRNDRY